MFRFARHRVIAGPALLLSLMMALPVGMATAADALEPTMLTVRVIAAGAKWVSPELGGADVWVADAESGKVLAMAQLEGDSGDTTALMEDPITRSQAIPTTATSALARLAVPLDEPRQVVVSVSGPRLGDGPVASASASVWMVPGVDLGGDQGLVIEVHGLAVSFISPTPHEVVTSAGPIEVPVEAAVEMLCGCPIGSDTPWPADDYTVEAVVLADGSEVSRSSLQYAGTDSRFTGSIELPGPGVYELQIIAQQDDVANMGVARNGMVIKAPDAS